MCKQGKNMFPWSLARRASEVNMLNKSKSIGCSKRQIMIFNMTWIKKTYVSGGGRAQTSLPNIETCAAGWMMRLSVQIDKWWHIFIDAKSFLKESSNGRGTRHHRNIIAGWWWRVFFWSKLKCKSIFHITVLLLHKIYVRVLYNTL